MKDNLIVVGAGWAGKSIVSSLAEKRPEHRVIGFIDDTQMGNVAIDVDGLRNREFPVLGETRNLVSIVTQERAEGVVLAVTHTRTDHLLEQLVKCYELGIPVYEMPEIYEKIAKKIPVRHINHNWIMPHLTAPPHDFYTVFHDATNYIIGLLGVLIVLPAFPFLALAIKLDSKGPVLYKQKRVGKNDKPFTLLKFRTMIKDADRNGGAWTTKNDQRITKLGRWLRKFRLDELPQFINILKGDMALIGPRPDAMDLLEKFREEIPFYDYRHLVRPGITGWAQVNHGNTCSVDGAIEKLQYDLYWIKNRSFWLDLKIMFRSIKVIFTGYGAV